jgi:hypothetical protein
MVGAATYSGAQSGQSSRQRRLAMMMVNPLLAGNLMAVDVGKWYC